MLVALTRGLDWPAAGPFDLEIGAVRPDLIVFCSPIPPALYVQSNENAASSHRRHAVRKEAERNPGNIRNDAK